HRLAVAGPYWSSLPIVDRGAQLTTMATVCIHEPHMGIFHSGFKISQSAPGRLINNVDAIGRPQRPVFGSLSRGDTPDAAIGNFQSKDVVVKKLIFIRLAVGDKEQLLAVGRPVNRVLIMRAVGQLANVSAGQVREKDVQAAIVVEGAIALAEIGLIKVAGNYDGIAGQILGFRSGRRRDKGNLFGVRGPSNVFAGGGQRTIGSSLVVQEARIGTIGMGDPKASLGAKLSIVGDPF